MTNKSQAGPAIALAGVNLSLGQGAAHVHILKDIDLHIGSGEAIGLVGPSGWENGANITQAVKDGKLTENQRTKMAKHKELVSQLEANKDSFKDKTPEERKTTFEAQRTAIEQWAKDNGVDAKWLLPFGGKGFGMRHHGFGHGPSASPEAD